MEDFEFTGFSDCRKREREARGIKELCDDSLKLGENFLNVNVQKYYMYMYYFDPLSLSLSPPVDLSCAELSKAFSGNALLARASYVSVSKDDLPHACAPSSREIYMSNAHRSFMERK